MFLLFPDGMVYKRKRTYQVKKYYPRPAPSRWSVYGSAGRQLVKDVMYLKTLINSEPHNWYQQLANNFNYNGLLYSLSDIPQGDNFNNRTGLRVLPRFLNVNWVVTGGEANAVVRIVLFRYWGEQTSDAAPAVTPAEVMRTVGTAFAPLSHLNDNNTGPKGDRQRRIEVHKSELINLDRTERTQQVGKWDVEVNGMNTSRKEHIEYPAAATSEPVSGGFYILFLSNSLTNSAMSLESKLTFYDN